MKGTSGFREVWSSTSRSSTNRLLDEQRYQFGNGSWHFPPTYHLIALSIDIWTKRNKLLTPFLSPELNRTIHV